jgi:hypothetical protein
MQFGIPRRNEVFEQMFSRVSVPGAGYLRVGMAFPTDNRPAEGE